MKTYAVVLAGGIGSRLWPLSRDLTPKHLLTLRGTENLLVQTIHRLLKKISLQRILVVTNRDQKFLVGDQLAAIDPALKENILAEPDQRNTLPAITWAVSHILKSQRDALVGVFPSDHIILDVDKFLRTLEKGLETAQGNFLVTFGIPPTRPATGFGYIQRGREKLSTGAWRVARFVEKPDRKVAQRYHLSKNYFWNTGMFVFKATAFLEEVQKYQPAVFNAFRNGRSIEEIYSKIPSLSVDRGIFEKSKQTVVLPDSFGWSDLGSWETVYEITPKDRRQNVCKGEIVAVDTEGCLLRSQRGLLATLGLKEMAVIQTEDACLIAPRSRLEEVKKMVEKLRREKDLRVRFSASEERPWGSFTVLEDGKGYKVKRVSVKPGQILNLQFHKYRMEYWVIVQGTGKITVGEKVVTLKANETIQIPRETKHRVENLGKDLLQFIEVQVGDYLGEEDVVPPPDDIYGTLNNWGVAHPDPA